MNTHTDSYWLGALATTVAIASTREKPKGFLTKMTAEFLDDRPTGHPLGDHVRETLKQKRAS